MIRADLERKMRRFGTGPQAQTFCRKSIMPLLKLYEKGFSSGYRPRSLTVDSEGRLTACQARPLYEIRRHLTRQIVAITVKASPITSDSFDLSSARLNKPQGPALTT
jgi:hypothetical protein